MERGSIEKLFKNGGPPPSIEETLKELRSFLLKLDPCAQFINQDSLEAHLVRLSGLPTEGSVYHHKFCGVLSELQVIAFLLRYQAHLVAYRHRTVFSEVDLIFLFKGVFHAFEVKTYSVTGQSRGFISYKQRQRLFRSFIKLQEKYNPLRMHFVSVGRKNLYLIPDFLSL